MPRSGNRRSSPIKLSLYKTSLCRNIVRGEECPFGGRCSFAHSSAELRSPGAARGSVGAPLSRPVVPPVAPVAPPAPVPPVAPPTPGPCFALVAWGACPELAAGRHCPRLHDPRVRGLAPPGLLPPSPGAAGAAGAAGALPTARDDWVSWPAWPAAAAPAGASTADGLWASFVDNLSRGPAAGTGDKRRLPVFRALTDESNCEVELLTSSVWASPPPRKGSPLDSDDSDGDFCFEPEPSPPPLGEESPPRSRHRRRAKPTPTTFIMPPRLAALNAAIEAF